MAKENAAKFYEALKSDKELQKKLKSAMDAFGGGKKDKEAVLAEVIFPTAKENGFAVTLDELKGYKPENGELEDEQLEAVSGGRIRDSDGKYDCYYDASYENAAVCVKCGSDRLKKNGVEFFWEPPLPYPSAYSVVTQCEECGYAWRYCSNRAFSGKMYELCVRIKQ